MKIKLILLVLLCIQSSIAQVKTSKEFSYTMSDPYEVVDGTKWYFNVTEDEVVSLKLVRSGFIFQKFSGSNLNEVKRMELPELPSGAAIESVIAIQESVNEIPVYQFATRRIVKMFDNEFAVEFYKKGKEDVMIRVKLEGK